MAAEIVHQPFTFTTTCRSGNIRRSQNLKFELITATPTDDFRKKVDIVARVGTAFTNCRWDVIHLKVRGKDDKIRVQLYNGEWVKGRELCCSFSFDSNSRDPEIVPVYITSLDCLKQKFKWEDDDNPPLPFPKMNAKKTKSSDEDDRKERTGWKQTINWDALANAAGLQPEMSDEDAEILQSLVNATDEEMEQGARAADQAETDSAPSEDYNPEEEEDVEIVVTLPKED